MLKQPTGFYLSQGCFLELRKICAWLNSFLWRHLVIWPKFWKIGNWVKDKSIVFNWKRYHQGIPNWSQPSWKQLYFKICSQLKVFINWQMRENGPPLRGKKLPTTSGLESIFKCFLECWKYHFWRDYLGSNFFTDNFILPLLSGYFYTIKSALESSNCVVPLFFLATGAIIVDSFGFVLMTLFYLNQFYYLP